MEGSLASRYNTPASDDILVERPLRILPRLPSDQDGTADASGAGMLIPLKGAFTEAQRRDEPTVPEVVAIEELTGEQIEAAEAEIEAEEHATA